MGFFSLQPTPRQLVSQPEAGDRSVFCLDSAVGRAGADGADGAWPPEEEGHNGNLDGFGLFVHKVEGKEVSPYGKGSTSIFLLVL